MDNHRVIIVSSYDPRALAHAHDTAMKIFGKSDVEVTRITTRGVTNFGSFVVCPDGHDGLSVQGVRHDGLRKQMLTWLKTVSNRVDWIYEQFGSNEAGARSYARNNLKHADMSKREQKTLAVIAMVLNSLFEPVPGIISVEDIDDMLDVDLIEELELEEDEGDEVFKELEARLPFHFTNPNPVVIYDRLSLRDILIVVMTQIETQNIAPAVAKKRLRPGAVNRGFHLNAKRKKRR